MKVLIVHRRDEVGAFWARSLERSGHETTVVTNPEEAIKALRFGEAGVMVLDLALPGRGAFQVSDYLILRQPELPVIAIASAPGISAVPYFGLIPNIRHIMGSTAQLADLAAIVDHYGPTTAVALRLRA